MGRWLGDGCGVREGQRRWFVATCLPGGVVFEVLCIKVLCIEVLCIKVECITHDTALRHPMLQFVADLICIYIYVHVYMYVFVYMFIYIYINPGFLNQCLRARGLGVAEVKDLRDDIVSGDDYIGMSKHCSLAPMGIHSSLHQSQYAITRFTHRCTAPAHSVPFALIWHFFLIPIRNFTHAHVHVCVKSRLC